MSDNLQRWKADFRKRLTRFRIKSEYVAAGSIYGTMGACALLSVVVASMSGNPILFEELKLLLSGIGGNITATMLKNWTEKATRAHEEMNAEQPTPEAMDAAGLNEQKIAGEIEDLLENDPQFRKELDKILRALDAFQSADEILKEGDREWFRKTLREELEKLGLDDTLAAALRNSYLSHLFAECRKLSLQGIDPKAATDERQYLHLDAIYTGLRTITSETYERMLKVSESRHERSALPDGSDHRLTALEQLNHEKYLVLLGDPGSGKSTFVNFVGLCLCGEALKDKEVNLTLLTAPLPGDDKKQQKQQSWDHDNLLPVRIILRDFAARGLPSPGKKGTAGHLWRFIVNELEPATLEGFAPTLQKELQEKGGLILLDGLDEVPEAERRRIQLQEVIDDFKSVYRNCRFLVTSRTYAYQKQEWRLPGFKDAVLAPFQMSEIKLFVDRWYAHIGPIRGWKKTNFQGRAILLKNEIVKNPRLAELAVRPLLLTLMAALHAWGDGRLPERREALYAEAVELLLDRWESAKLEIDKDGNYKVVEESLTEWLQTDRQAVRNLLNQLAYQAHESQPELYGTADIAEDTLVSGLMNLTKNPDLRPKRLIDYLSRRAGLLIPRGVRVYTFPHRSFQEYLAACYLTARDFPDEIGELVIADSNRWREVALLAAAKAAGGHSTAIWLFIDYLCPENHRCADKNMEDLWGAQIAGQAIGELYDQINISNRRRALYDRLRQALLSVLRCAELPATERAITGVNLSIISDPRKEVLTLEAMPFCYVPAGPFQMGEDKKLHTNGHLNYSYWISQYPVTNAQFDFFVQAGGYEQERYWAEAQGAGVWKDGKVKDAYDDDYRSDPIDPGKPYNLSNHPVVEVNWYEMLAFCRWLGEEWREKYLLPEGWEITLPSEAEWEKAARGGLEIPENPIIETVSSIGGSPDPDDAAMLIPNPSPQRVYPWGDGVDVEKANYDQGGIGATNTVGVFPKGASRCGCEELSGNVWEWTRSKYADYPYDPGDGREDFAGSETRVLRGGAFDYDGVTLRCACRSLYNPVNRNWYFGFRVVARPRSS